MTPAPMVIDTFSRVALLGLRFWDDVTRANIGEGLNVTAYRLSHPDRRFALSANGVAIYVLQNAWLPVEFGLGDQEYWDSLPAPREWVIEVMDAADRFIPFSFETPVPHRDLFQWVCDSPIGASGSLPLFSSPTRSIAGFGVIRADLRDETLFDARTQRYAPAPWAVIEAWYEGQRIGRGLANDQGRITLVFPYPEPVNPPIVSPPAQRKALTAQSWLFDLRAYYSPPVERRDLPDLCAALMQSPASLVSAISPPSPLTQVTVGYGVDLVLKTAGRSELLITP